MRSCSARYRCFRRKVYVVLVAQDLQALPHTTGIRAKINWGVDRDVTKMIINCEIDVCQSTRRYLLDKKFCNLRTLKRVSAAQGGLKEHCCAFTIEFGYSRMKYTKHLQGDLYARVDMFTAKYRHIFIQNLYAQEIREIR